MDYADQRYYASQYGRFNTPDPYAGSADPKTPWSWNRYGYTGGDPVNNNDPHGLDNVCGPDGTFDGEGCIDTGGGDYGGGDTPPSLNPCVQVYEGIPGGVNCTPPSTAPVAPVQPPAGPKCWQNVGNISATLSNLGTDIEQDVQVGPNGTFSASDLQLLTTDVNSDVASEMTAIGGGTTASPYYIGGHFNLTISASQIAAFSTSDQQTFSADFWGGTGDGVRQAATTGLAGADGYTLHSHGGVNAPYSFHFDRFNPQDLAGLVGHGVWDVLGGHLGHPCLDPAWH
jgi:hypothetical protein